MPAVTGGVQAGLDQQFSWNHQAGLNLPFSDLQSTETQSSTLGGGAAKGRAVAWWQSHTWSQNAESQRPNNHWHSLPQNLLFSPFIPLPKQHIFLFISISLMLRTFHPFSSRQITLTLPSEPMKYSLAIFLTIPANSALSYLHAQPLHLSLQLLASGIHQHLVCSVETAAHQGSTWQNWSGTTKPTTTLIVPYSQLCLEQYHHWCISECSSRSVGYFMAVNYRSPTWQISLPRRIGDHGICPLPLCCSKPGLSSCSNAKELLAHARRVRSPSRGLTLHREV